MFEIEPKNNRVVAYVRKSSEDNVKGEASKQLNSIEYQKNFTQEAIKKYDLIVVHKFEDDKSGYEAYVREGFNSMMTYLQDHKDEVDGIVCTEISRLARNFADGGLVLWYMQKGIIKRIYTPSKIFTNSSSDQMMVAIEFTMSKKSSDEGSYRTKEGMKSKVRTMKHPSQPAILGYKGEGPRGRREWVIDDKKGPLVEQVFEQFATGKYTFEQIAEYAFNIGLRSSNKKTIIGKISKNSWYNRLSDIKYTGIFESEGELVVGEYKALISEQLFKQVQDVIEYHQHPKEMHLDYAYSNKLIKCGICGGWLSGTHKKGITYYRCGKRNLPCKGAKGNSITESAIEKQLITVFEKFEINQEGWEKARDYVSEQNQPEKIKLNKQIRELEGKIGAEKERQSQIGIKYSSGEMSKDEHDRLLNYCYRQEASYRNTMVKCQNIVHELDQLMDNFLENIKYVTKRLRIALPENKREFVTIFCENFILKDKKLVWEWKKPYYFWVKNAKSSDVLPRVDSDHEPTAYKKS